MMLPAHVTTPRCHHCLRWIKASCLSSRDTRRGRNCKRTSRKLFSSGAKHKKKKDVNLYLADGDCWKHQKSIKEEGLVVELPVQLYWEMWENTARSFRHVSEGSLATKPRLHGPE